MDFQELFLLVKLSLEQIVVKTVDDQVFQSPDIFDLQVFGQLVVLEDLAVRSELSN